MGHTCEARASQMNGMGKRIYPRHYSLRSRDAGLAPECAPSMIQAVLEKDNAQEPPAAAPAAWLAFICSCIFFLISAGVGCATCVATIQL
jgi:hypothetical protein